MFEEIVARRPQADHEARLEPEQVEAFREDGFTSIERITSDEEIAWLGQVYDALFKARFQAVPGGYFDLARPYESDGPDLLPQILTPEVAIPELRQTALYRNARRLAAELLGVPDRELRGWGHMIRKPARIGAPLPWHQDEAYWDPAFAYRSLGVWMPLDPATLQSGCMRFIPGSQRGAVRVHRHIHDDASTHGLVTDDVPEDRMLAVPVSPGGATFHHCRTLHSSGANTSDRARRAYANEFGLPPVARDLPDDRPWILEGKQAWERRTP